MHTAFYNKSSQPQKLQNKNKLYMQTHVHKSGLGFWTRCGFYYVKECKSTSTTNCQQLIPSKYEIKKKKLYARI